MKKRFIDIVVYLSAIFLDSFGIALLIKTSFGATPFGILTSNVTLVIPLTVGMFSFLYEMLYILLASRISKSRVKWELLIYSVIFAVFIDLHLTLIPNMVSYSIYFKIGITLIGIVFVDFAKSLFNITVYPKLSTVELIYAIANRFKLRLDTVSRIINFNNVAIGLVFSFIADKPFNNIGIGTVMALLLFGKVLQYTSGFVEKKYEEIIK